MGVRSGHQGGVTARGGAPTSDRGDDLTVILLVYTHPRMPTMYRWADHGPLYHTPNWATGKVTGGALEQAMWAPRGWGGSTPRGAVDRGAGGRWSTVSRTRCASARSPSPPGCMNTGTSTNQALQLLSATYPYRGLYPLTTIVLRGRGGGGATGVLRGRGGGRATGVLTISGPPRATVGSGGAVCGSPGTPPLPGTSSTLAPTRSTHIRARCACPLSRDQGIQVRSQVTHHLSGDYDGGDRKHGRGGHLDRLPP